jgi:hypothetical protein
LLIFAAAKSAPDYVTAGFAQSGWTGSGRLGGSAREKPQGW